MMHISLKVFICLILSMALVWARSSEVPDAFVEPACDVTLFVPQVTPGTKTEVMVPMRDCVELATNVYLPRNPGPFPALLIRLPYDKNRGMKEFPITEALAFLFRLSGYAVVVQDTRGKFASQGEWDPFVHEQEDGLDTVRWLEAQPWFNGNLGLVGGSYYGFTQLAVAHQKPSCLKAMAPMVTTGDIYTWLYKNGLPRADIAVNWGLGSWKHDDYDALTEEQFLEAALHTPLTSGDDVTTGDMPWYDAWLEHTFRGAFYDRFLPPDVYEDIDVPILMVTGWYDIFLSEQLGDFLTAQAREARNGQTRIIIGPWTHTMGIGEQQDYPYRQPKSLISFIGKIIHWFDHYLKGNPLGNVPGPVHAYDPGKGTWLDRDTLWSPDRKQVAFYLGGNQGAAGCTPAGTLSGTPPVEAARIDYTYDPLDPVVRYGGALLGMANGCLFEEAGCDRPDILTFLSDPMGVDTTVEGEIVLELPVSSSAPDTAFMGRLSLVSTDGKAYVLRQGVATLTHRHGDKVPAPYKPGQVVDLRIAMAPLLWTLKAGERLRLEVSSSSFPAVVQHPNVAWAPFDEPVPLPAEQAVYLLPENPARMVVPVAR